MAVPLTTVFTPPARCFSTMTWPGPGIGITVAGGATCIPPGGETTDRSFAFSPGLYCPQSFIAATTSLRVIGTVTETRAICCPLLDGFPGLSGSIFSWNPDSTDLWYPSMGCTFHYTDYTDVNVLLTGTKTFTSTFQGSIALHAYSVQIAWQASDRTTVMAPSSSAVLSGSGVSTSSATPTRIQTVSVTITPSNSGFIASLTASDAAITSPSSSITISGLSPIVTSSSASSSATLSTSSYELSTAAKAGIGTMGACLVIAFALIAFFLVRSRTRQSKFKTGGDIYDYTNGTGVYVECEQAQSKGVWKG